MESAQEFAEKYGKNTLLELENEQQRLRELVNETLVFEAKATGVTELEAYLFADESVAVNIYKCVKNIAKFVFGENCPIEGSDIFWTKCYFGITNSDFFENDILKGKYAGREHGFAEYWLKGFDWIDYLQAKNKYIQELEATRF